MSQTEEPHVVKVQLPLQAQRTQVNEITPARCEHTHRCALHQLCPPEDHALDFYRFPQEPRLLVGSHCLGLFTESGKKKKKKVKIDKTKQCSWLREIRALGRVDTVKHRNTQEKQESLRPRSHACVGRWPADGGTQGGF